MPEVPEGALVITPQDMWKQMHENMGSIKDSLSSLRDEVHGLPAQVAEHDAYLNTLRQAGLPERFVAVEADVASMKGRISWAFGVGAALCFVSGLIGSLLVPLLVG